MRRDEFISKATETLSAIGRVSFNLKNSPDNPFTTARTRSYLNTLEKISENISVILKFNFFSYSQYYSRSERIEIEELTTSLERYLTIAADALLTDEGYQEIQRNSEQLIQHARVARLISSTLKNNEINTIIDNKISTETIKISEIKNEIDITLENTRSMLKSNTIANEKIIELTKTLNNETDKSTTNSNEISQILTKSRTIFGNIESIHETIKNADLTLAEISSKYNKSYNNLSVLVEQSKYDIDELVGKTETINKLNEVISAEISQSQDLISKAKSALNLSGTYRLSRHFKGAFELANRNKWLWAIISIFFAIICMVFIGYMLYEMHYVDSSQEKTQETHLLLLFLARFSMIPILLGFFVFSAMQYVKQNQITEDYAHKKLLSETLISFRQEIDRNGSDKASIFMDSILKSVLDSPLNSIDKKAHHNEINKINDFIKTTTQINKEIIKKLNPTTEKTKRKGKEKGKE